jgi:hypothetical protein
MSEVDASEAYRVGYGTVQAMLDGETKRSVVLEKTDGKVKTGLTELPNIAGKERQVPDEYIDGMNGPTQEFIDEYLYLVGGPVALPHYSKGRFNAVEVPEAVKSSPYVAGKMG